MSNIWRRFRKSMLADTADAYAGELSHHLQEAL